MKPAILALLIAAAAMGLVAVATAEAVQAQATFSASGSMVATAQRSGARIFARSPVESVSGEGNVIAPLLGRQLAEALIANDVGRLALPLVPPSVPLLRNPYDILLRKTAIPLARRTERLQPY